ncbi:MAG: 30S ribosomal protein S6 [Cytophagales bacterium]|nr:MAG: 30S ribosomal protein S6 [Cytophagales bacterium]
MDLKKNYETVFILTPVLSDVQMKDAVEKFKKILTDNGANIIHEDIWGLKNFAYPIKKKNTGFYTVLEFEADPKTISMLEIEYRRDERVLRYITVALDKHGVAYNAKKRNKLSGKETNNEVENN